MSAPIRGFVFENGMMIVFDRNGEQVPEYQGYASENVTKLLNDYPDCLVSGEKWESFRDRQMEED